MKFATWCTLIENNSNFSKFFTIPKDVALCSSWYVSYTMLNKELHILNKDWNQQKHWKCFSDFFETSGLLWHWCLCHESSDFLFVEGVWFGKTWVWIRKKNNKKIWLHCLFKTSLRLFFISPLMLPHQIDKENTLNSFIATFLISHIGETMSANNMSAKITFPFCVYQRCYVSENN